MTQTERPIGRSSKINAFLASLSPLFAVHSVSTNCPLSSSSSNEISCGSERGQLTLAARAVRSLSASFTVALSLLDDKKTTLCTPFLFLPHRQCPSG